MVQMSWFKKLFAADQEASMKRFLFFAVIAAYIVQHFLIMYLKIEIANKELVMNSQDGLKLLGLILGGYVAGEKFFNNSKIGGVQNLVSQDVQQQTVKTDSVTIAKKDEPLKE